MTELGRASCRGVGTVLSNNPYKNVVHKASLTHHFAADIHLHFISGALSCALFHAYKAMFLLTRTIHPIPVLQKKKHYTGYAGIFLYS